MSQQYGGKAALATRPTVRDILSSTNTTPIVVVTTVNHGYLTGDTVVIAGHATNTSANGSWSIIVTGPDRFSLTGSAGVGVGLATGAAAAQGLAPSYEITDDGDNADAASVTVALTTLGDRAAWMSERIGAWKLLEHMLLAPVSASDTPSTAATWTQNAYTAGHKLVATLTGKLIPGDRIVWRTMLQLNLAAAFERFLVKVMHDATGAGAIVDIPTGSARAIVTGTAAGVSDVTVPLSGSWVVPSNFVHDATNGYRFYIVGRSAAGSTFKLLDCSTYELLAMRSTT